MQETLLENGANLLVYTARVDQVSLSDGDVVSHFSGMPVVAVAKCMMDVPAAFLGVSGWCANNMDDSSSLRTGSSGGIDGGQLANSVVCNESSDALYPCIPIRGVSCIQLIGITDQRKVQRFDVIEQLEDMISGNAMD